MSASAGVCGPYLVRSPVMARGLDGYPLDMWPGQLFHVVRDAMESGQYLCTAQCSDCAGLIWFKLPVDVVRAGRVVAPAPLYPTVEEWQRLRDAHAAVGIVCQPPPH